MRHFGSHFHDFEEDQFMKNKKQTYVSFFAKSLSLLSCLTPSLLSASVIGDKINEVAGEANGIITGTGSPLVTAVIGVAAGVAVGIYRQNVWAAGVAALAGGALANIFPDLWVAGR